MLIKIISFVFSLIYYGKKDEQYLMTGRSFYWLGKCITDICQILVEKLPLDWLFSYLLRRNSFKGFSLKADLLWISHYEYGPSFSHYHAFECGSVQNRIKNRSYAHIRANLCPLRSIFDRSVFRLPPLSFPQWNPAMSFS